MCPSIIYIVFDFSSKRALEQKAIILDAVIRGNAPDFKESHLKVQGPFRKPNDQFIQGHLGTTTNIR
jgi:hypothetical protein